MPAPWSSSSSSAVVATAIGARLVWWQVVQQRLAGRRWPSNQLAQHEQLPAERGEITDVNGVLLATSVELQSVFATPPSIEDPAARPPLLAPVLGMDMDASCASC